MATRLFKVDIKEQAESRCYLQHCALSVNGLPDTGGHDVEVEHLSTLCQEQRRIAWAFQREVRVGDRTGHGFIIDQPHVSLAED
jgi:hypothetical protein